MEVDIQFYLVLQIVCFDQCVQVVGIFWCVGWFGYDQFDWCFGQCYCFDQVVLVFVGIDVVIGEDVIVVGVIGKQFGIV